MKKTTTEIFEEICGKLSKPTKFLLAQMDEANLLIDKSSFPVMIYIPPIVTDTPTPGGRVNPSQPFNAFLLDKYTKQMTRDFSYNKIDIEIVQPMRALGREFIVAVEHYRHEDNSLLIDPLVGIGSRQYRPAFDETDASLHGVVITCTMPVIEDIGICA